MFPKILGRKSSKLSFIPPDNQADSQGRVKKHNGVMGKNYEGL